MTSIGTGYDLSASTYSPDGRIFQVLYISMLSSLADHLPRSSMPPRPSKTRGVCFRLSHSINSANPMPYSTAIGLKVKDGVVLAVEKLIHSKLLVPEANRRIQTIDRHIGLVRLPSPR
jgi:20S proteasome subunit alpha 7